MNNKRKETYKKDKFEVKGQPYARKPKIRSFHPVVCVARGERGEFRHTEIQPPEITGRYQDEKGSFTFNINHAGANIEGVMAKIVSGDVNSRNKEEEKQANARKPVAFFQGVWNGKNSFILTPKPDQEVEDLFGDEMEMYFLVGGELTGSRQSRKLTLKLWEPGKENVVDEYKLVLTEENTKPITPTLLYKALDALPDHSEMEKEYRVLIVTDQWAPLITQWLRYLRDTLLLMKNEVVDSSKVLFRMDMGFRRDLDAERFSKELRQEFNNKLKDKHIQISEKVVIHAIHAIVKYANWGEWVVHDEGKKKRYFIEPKDGRLNVHASKDTSIAELLKEYFARTPKDGNPDEKAKRLKVANELDGYLATVVFPRGHLAWHRDELPLARYYARQILASKRWEHKNVSRTYLDWIHIIFSQIARDGMELKGLRTIRENLGLVADTDLDSSSLPRYRYEIKLSLGGAAVSLKVLIAIKAGGFAGPITIKQYDGDSTDENWEAGYYAWVSVAGLGVGLGGGIKRGFEASGTAWSHSNWAMEDFEGTFYLGEASAEVGFGLGVGYSGTVMNIEGSEVWPTLIVTMSGYSASFEAKAQVGAEGKGGYGRIYSMSDEVEIVPATNVSRNISAEIKPKMEDEIHFLCGSSRLTEAGLHILRTFCATELASLMSPGSQLTIIGHTDRLDTEERNKTLSLDRAKNTKLAIKEILGGKLKIIDDDEHFETYGKGEEEAKKKYESGEDPTRIDGKTRAEDRKVEIILNSRLVVALRGG